MALLPVRRPARRFLISQLDLLQLADKHEPAASASPPGYRKATCVKCSRPMTRMWHLWLRSGGFKKEVHMCKRCGRGYLC